MQRTIQTSKLLKKDILSLFSEVEIVVALSSFLHILENWSRVSAFPYKHEVNNEAHNFIIEHDMGNFIIELC
jgi:hypothetical protein